MPALTRAAASRLQSQALPDGSSDDGNSGGSTAAFVLRGSVTDKAAAVWQHRGAPAKAFWPLSS